MSTTNEIDKAASGTFHHGADTNSNQESSPKRYRAESRSSKVGNDVGVVFDEYILLPHPTLCVFGKRPVDIHEK